MGGIPLFLIMLGLILGGVIVLAAIVVGVLRLAAWRERRLKHRFEDDFRAAIEAEFGADYAGGLVERLRRQGL